MFSFNHVELFGGVVKFTPIIEVILIIFVCHFIYDWRKDYRSTGWKLSDDSYVAELSENAFKAFQSTNEEYIAGIERYYEDLLAIKQES